MNAAHLVGDTAITRPPFGRSSLRPERLVEAMAMLVVLNATRPRLG